MVEEQQRVHWTGHRYLRVYYIHGTTYYGDRENVKSRNYNSGCAGKAFATFGYEIMNTRARSITHPGAVDIGERVDYREILSRFTRQFGSRRFDAICYVISLRFVYNVVLSATGRNVATGQSPGQHGYPSSSLLLVPPPLAEEDVQIRTAGMF